MIAPVMEILQESGAPGTGAAGLLPAPGVDANRFVQVLAGRLQDDPRALLQEPLKRAGLTDSAFLEPAVHPALAQIVASLTGAELRAQRMGELMPASLVESGAATPGEVGTAAPGMPGAAPAGSGLPSATAGDAPLPPDLYRALMTSARGDAPQAASRDSAAPLPPDLAQPVAEAVQLRPGGEQAGGGRPDLQAVLRHALENEAARTESPARLAVRQEPLSEPPPAALRAREESRGLATALERSLEPPPEQPQMRPAPPSGLERGAGNAPPTPAGSPMNSGDGDPNAFSQNRQPVPGAVPVPSQTSDPGSANGVFEVPLAGASQSVSQGEGGAAGPRVPASQVSETVTAQVERLTEGGGGTARIRLNPPNLGELQLSVTVRGNAVEVSVVAREVAAQALVEGGREQLADALASRELRMESFDVHSPPRDGSDPGGGEARARGQAAGEPQDQPGRQDRGGRPRAPAPQALSDPPPVQATSSGTGRVDLRV